MIILTSITDSIKIKLSGSVITRQLSCFASYRETTSTTLTPGRNTTTTNNTNLVDLVGSPPPSTQRVIDYLSVYNDDTAESIVTIFFDENGTQYELCVTALSSGEKIEYVEGKGFQSFDINGCLKKSISSQYNSTNVPWELVVLSNDVINNNAVANTIADITGLSFPVTGGSVYWFQFWIPYTSAAAATGCRFSINSAATITSLFYTSKYSLTTTTQTINQGLSTFDSPATTSGSSPATLVGIATIEGVIIPTNSGTVIARFASEVANSAITAKAGAFVKYKLVG